MLLHVTHETRYAYAPAVSTAQHQVHLRPIQAGGQQLLSHELIISPQPDQCVACDDVYGNTRTYISLQQTHEELRITARSLVRTVAPREPASDMSWEQVREFFRYRRGAPYDPAAEFCFASPYVPRHEHFAAYARASFEAGRPALDATRELMQRIHADFLYESHSTDVGTPALESLRLRRGVCQDFAHVMIGCLRGMGLPARYVSGYLLTAPPPGQARLVGCDASHAWASVFLPDAGWCDFDPTNRRAPGEDYVTLALGRDYSDVSPIRGVILGGADHTLSVAVTVEPA